MLPARSAHRGLTLLEVVLATLILASAAMLATTGLGAVQRINQLDQDRLNAAEVAHRLILNHIIDPDSLPESSEPIRQGTGVYRFLLSEEALEQEELALEGRSRRRARPLSQMTSNERLQAGLMKVTVKVYRHTGAPSIDTDGGPLVEISRIYDPFDTDEESVLFNQLDHLMGGMSLPPGVGAGSGDRDGGGAR